MDLTFRNATKFYGPVIGVNDVSCLITPGITALFGANGAGKSTMIKLASGQLRASLGAVLVGEHDAWSTAAKWHLGYSPDIDSFYEEMTGFEFVDTMARLYGFRAAEARQRTADALAQVDMSARGRRKIAGFSHGMRQRIKLAQALVHDPQLLLLDEPMAGIDPGGRRDLFALLHGLAETGKTILISTHMLAQVEDVADHVLMIARGRIIASGTLAEIRGLLDNEPLTVGVTAGDARRLAALLIGQPAVHSVEVREQQLTLRTQNPGEFFATLNRLVVEHDLDILRLETLDAGADAVFTYLQRGG